MGPMHPSFREVGRILDQFQSLVADGFTAPSGLHLPASPARRRPLLGRELAEACQRAGLEEPQADRVAAEVLEELPRLRRLLGEDVDAALHHDPAAASREEVEACYPGFRAVAAHRLAHEVLRRGVPMLPRMLSEYAHTATGIDIHPGAAVGPRFFIDHGGGVVIGETTRIGAGVTLYQGVTLGALNFPRDGSGKVLRVERRHPTLEDEVVVYSNSTILGGDTIIGRGSIIGANVWLTESVPAGTLVVQKTPTLLRRDRQGDGSFESPPESEQ